MLDIKLSGIIFLDALVTRRVEFVSLTNGLVPKEIMVKCAGLYCEIWKEPPWCEDFWKLDEVLADLDEQLKRPGAAGFLAVILKPIGCQVIGFTWGYEVTRDELREIAGIDLLDNLFADGKAVFYIDELGVASQYRGHGVGRTLSQLVIDKVGKDGIDILVLRTDKEAKAARSLYLKFGFKDLGVTDAEHLDRTYLVLYL